MIAIALVILALIPGFYMIFRNFKFTEYHFQQDLVGAILFSFFNLVGPGLLALGIFGNLFGIMEDYGTGEAECLVVDYNSGGLIWKTHEGTVVLGKMNNPTYANIKEKVSTKDPVLGKKLHESIGKVVRLKYKGWFISPWSEGSSGNIITEISVAEKE